MRTFTTGKWVRAIENRNKLLPTNRLEVKTNNQHICKSNKYVNYLNILNRN